MMERNSSECLLKKLDEEIVLLDGAMGTMIQQHKPEEILRIRKNIQSLKIPKSL